MRIFFFFRPYLRHAEVPGPGIKPAPQPRHQWVLNPLHQKGSFPNFMFLLNRKGIKKIRTVEGKVHLKGRPIRAIPKASIQQEVCALRLMVYTCYSNGKQSVCFNTNTTQSETKFPYKGAPSRDKTLQKQHCFAPRHWPNVKLYVSVWDSKNISNRLHPALF